MQPVLTSGLPPQTERDALQAKLSLARRAMLVADEGDVLSFDRAVVKAHHKRNFGDVLMPEDDTNIHIGDIVSQPTAKPTQPKQGLSTLAALGIGLLGAAIPGAGVLGYLLNAAPAVIQTIEKKTVTPGDGDTKYQLRLLP